MLSFVMTGLMFVTVDAAQVYAYAFHEGMTPPYPGLPEFPMVVPMLRGSLDDPRLSPFSEDVISLFHPQAVSAGPWVNQEIVFAWLDGEKLLLADEGGAASLGIVGGQRWQNGWFDFAMVDALRKEAGGEVLPQLYGTEWVLIENRTAAALLLLDDVGKAASPEEGGRVLARVPPGKSVMRPVLRFRPPWLVVPPGHKFRLDVTHSAATEEARGGVRVSSREVAVNEAEMPRRSGCVVRVEGASGGMLPVIAAALVLFGGLVAWYWSNVRWRAA